MSTSDDSVRRRPSLWTYFSFSRPTTPNPRGRTPSTSLPKPNASYDDPFEKPDRHSESGRGGSFSRVMHKAKDAWMNQGQRTRLLKAGGLVFFLVCIWLFLSNGHASAGGSQRGFEQGDVATDSTTATGRCTRGVKGKPLVQYALMIDAGSTGSRIHVYRFNNCGTTPDLEDEVFKQTEKKAGGSGLSSYDTDSEGAAASLDILMAAAMESVPDKLKSCTPIAVKATAGLRKLGTAKSDAILAAVRNRLETKYPFPVLSEAKGGVEVMDGKDEGVYAWITTNYLLGKIGGPDKSPTAAVFDLGGGSTQIVFQPTFPGAPEGGMPEVMKEGDHKYELAFGGRNFSLYQHSYLGYGLMEARRQLHELVLANALKESPSRSDFVTKPIHNPCIAPGLTRQVKVAPPAGSELGSEIDVKMVGPATGAPAQCRALAEKLLLKEKECTIAPCAFNGVHQPSLAKTFAREEIYLFSYFYDRTNPIGMPESFTLSELKSVTERVCQGEAGGNWDMFESVEGALEELRGRPEHCLDLNFILALLHTGYEIPLEREVKTAKKMKGWELGWALGASLPLLERDGWACRISEVS